MSTKQNLSMGSKISLVHLQSPQERQNGGVRTSLGSKVEETTTLGDLHYPMGFKIDPVHLQTPQECQNGGVQTSLHPRSARMVEWRLPSTLLF